MGKASILLVAGYTLLLLVSSLTMSSVATEANDNSYGYVEGALVRNIALAGANIGCSVLFSSPPLLNGNPWWPGYTSPVAFGGGSFVVLMDSTSSVDPLSLEPRLTLRSIGTFGDSSHTITVVLRPSNFAKFALYAGAAGAPNAYWETGDTALGPVHAEGVLMVHGSPYFGGKITTKDGIDSTTWAGHPIIAAGLESGVSIPLNKSYQGLGVAAGSEGKRFDDANGDLYLTFKSDSLTWRRTTTSDTTVDAGLFAPNGVIVLGHGNVYVKGVVKGRYTIGALDSTGGYATGRIIIDDDIVYARDPRVDPTSTDMLGLVAYHDINIGGDPNRTSFAVDASLFSYTMGVTVDAYDTRQPGQLRALGGWIMQNIFPTSNGIPLGQPGSTGFKCTIVFDNRFRTSSPPSFPTTGTYEILEWYE
jgi:hypothetical protein